MSEITTWKALKRSQHYKKYSREIEEVIYELPDGSTAEFYLKKEGRVACVLGLTATQQVILVRQYRPGPDAILNELPGGYVEPHEEPIVGGEREFLEETGYTGDFTYVGSCLDDAYSTGVRHVLVAQNCHKIQEPQQTPTEQTEVVLMDLPDFREHLRSGQLTDVEVGYLALDHLGLL